MLPLMSACAMALIVEMVFFGPIGLNVLDIPIRKVLIGILILSSLVPMLTRKATEVWQVWLLIGMVLFLLVWGIVVPLANGVRLDMSIAEMQPIVAILLLFPFFYLFLEYGPHRYLKVLEISATIMAIIVSVFYVLTNIFGFVALGYELRQFYYSLNETDFGIYIGLLPDGSFRLMLVNFIIFPIMLSFYTWTRINISMVALFSFATFATGTRAFLGVAVLVVGVAMIRKRPVLAVPAIAIILYLIFYYVLQDSELRIFDFTSDFTSVSARFSQFFALTAMFDSYPVFGAGLGASASVIRSIDAPYSYELTYIALFAKLGIIGSAVVVLSLVLWLGRLMRTNPDRASILTLIAGIIMMTATNPYLINLVGMTITAFLLAMGMWYNKRAAKTPALPGSQRLSHA